MENYNGNSVTAIMYRISLAGSIYYVWKERNQIVFQEKRMDVNIITKKIIQDVYIRGSLKVKLASYLDKLNFYPS